MSREKRVNKRERYRERERARDTRAKEGEKRI